MVGRGGAYIQLIAKELACFTIYNTVMRRWGRGLTSDDDTYDTFLSLFSMATISCGKNLRFLLDAAN
jgi:hypothetical protein